jgi:hypothetical protein
VEPQLDGFRSNTQSTEPQLDGFLSDTFDTIGRVAKKAVNAVVGGATTAKNTVSSGLWESNSPSYAKVLKTGSMSLAAQGVNASGLAAWKNALDITGVGLAVCHDSINDPNPDKDLALGREFFQALKATQPNQSLVSLRQKANQAAKFVYTTYKNQILFSKAETNAPPSAIEEKLNKYMPGMTKAFYKPFADRFSGGASPALVRDPVGWPKREATRQANEAAVKKELAEALDDLSKKKAQAKLDAIQLIKAQNALRLTVAESNVQALSLKETAYQQQQELALQAENLRQQALQTQEDLEAQQERLQRRTSSTRKIAGVVLGIVGIAALLYMFSKSAR